MELRGFVLEMNNEKGTARRLYLRGDDLARMDRIAKTTGLSQTELMTQILHAGIYAIEEQGGMLFLPFRLRVVPPSCVQNQASL